MDLKLTFIRLVSALSRYDGNTLLFHEFGVHLDLDFSRPEILQTISKVPNEVFNADYVVAEVVEFAGGDVVVTAPFSQMHVEIDPIALVFPENRNLEVDDLLEKADKVPRPNDHWHFLLHLIA